jgi:hypothetical protein
MVWRGTITGWVKPAEELNLLGAVGVPRSFKKRSVGFRINSDAVAKGASR